MASISSLMGSSSSSSIFGSRTNNMITGLASGLDTESMIEGMVQGYQQKILQLQQSKTKVQWQQNAYQSISDKLVEFSRKYTSYAYSTTNLMSNSFFNNAVITTAKGVNADKITASGKSDSTIVINEVKQLATAAKYNISADHLGADGVSASTEQVWLGDKKPLSNMSGSLTINYGTKKITLEFSETECFGDEDGNLDVDAFQEAINKKLAEQKITNSAGEQVEASKLISAEVDDKGNVIFKSKDSNSVSIDGATGDFAKRISNLEEAVKGDSNTLCLDTKNVVDTSGTKGKYLSGKEFTVTLNGKSKTITLGEIEPKGKENWNQATVRVMQEALSKAFGDQHKIDVSVSGGVFKFQTVDSMGNPVEGDTISIKAVDSDVGEVFFGEGNYGVSNYLDVSKTLGSLGKMEYNEDKTTCTLTLNGMVLTGKATQIAEEDRIEDPDEEGVFYDANGNKLDEEGYVLNADGERLYSFTATVNGEEIGTYTQDTALETIINNINSNSEAGVNVSYSKLTNQFVFTAKDTGSAGKIEMTGENNLAAALFGDTKDGALTDAEGKFTEGIDAKLTATINGDTVELTRSSNTVELDGMTITLEGTFDAKRDGDGNIIDKNEGVTFTSKTDTDTVFDAIKQMVTDFNAMATEIKKAYTDQPLKQTDGSRYEPLTAEDEADMTESEIKAYEEKAKTGILFMDRDLSSLYSELRGAVAAGGMDSAYLRSIGIETSYEDGLTTITLDESKLRAALESDLDGVRDIFTKSKENGADSDGIMASIQKVTDKYAATTGATKGILIEKAGSQYSPTAALSNTMLDKMDEIDKQISSWQSKLSDKVDYYTNKFTQLELLINQMNSQSSALAGLTGGY